MVETQFIQALGISHTGYLRANNEDRWGITEIGIPPENTGSALLAVLADGVGGQQGGEIAALLAVDTITASITATPLENPLQALENAIQEANTKINEHGQQNSDVHGMGSTVVCALLLGKRLFTASLGDSRIYLVRKDTIQQTSQDHTWLNEARSAGVAGLEQMNRNHPFAHVLNRYLGTPSSPIVDLRLRLNPEESEEQTLSNQGTELLSGEFVLLSSDGLTDMVSNAQILETFQSLPFEQIPDALVAMALENGGHDNITLIVIRVL